MDYSALRGQSLPATDNLTMENEGRNTGMTSNTHTYSLGLDVGSVSVKCAVTNEAGTVILTRYRRSAGQPVATTLSLFEEILASHGDLVLGGTMVTGSGKELIGTPTGMGMTNEIIAHATAACHVHGEARHIFEIGGQDSKFITIGRDRAGKPYVQDHTFNQLCAAGTGAFLDQQAERLGLTIEALGRVASQAKRAARVAGRCAVFAKSDMIHLQQQAVPVEEIAAGLCLALARNFLATLCKGKVPQPPILLQGGVAANAGVVKAFRELLHLEDSELLIPDDFALMGALGAALLAGESPLARPAPLSTLVSQLSLVKDQAPAGSGLMPIVRPESSETVTEQEPPGCRRQPFFLGVDIGSVSSKAAIIDADGVLVAGSYRPTAGKPIAALQATMAELATALADKATMAHVATTGSGRHIAKALLGGGTALDEISAQALACRHFFPMADTVIEIGGQDSKFLRLRDGQLQSFKMNKACAAGTGAFLEEQAGRLSIAIKEEFAEKAFTSTSPARLGSKCTVFMDTDLVHHLQRGTATADLCAGLAYSIAENYLEKVVGASRLGSSIVFQGGVAKNAAVVAVFRELCQAEVRVHPYPEISGAFGAALAARDEYLLTGKTFALALPAGELAASSETFGCQDCDNLCRISKITAGGSTAFFGSVCGRFEKAQPQAISACEPFAERDRLLQASVGQFPARTTRGVLGVPMALSLHDHLPFWGTLFNALGYTPVYSGKTRRSQLEAGILHTPGDFCLPMKVLFGHVHSLIEAGIGRIFIPHLRMFVPQKERIPRYACPYTQAAAYVVRENLDAQAEFLTLDYPLAGEHGHWLAETGARLGIGREELQEALQEALAAQKRFTDGCLAAGARIINDLQRHNRRGAVLLGRPYNTSDRLINLNLARKLQALDITPLPYDFLPPGAEPLPELWSRIRWGYGRRLVQAARAMKAHPFLGAVVVSNFGCGPDGFIDQYLEHELRELPYIVLEFDDHQAEAGLLTRLEAFARGLTTATTTKRQARTVTGRDPGKPRRPLREYTYYVPAFMDHAHALTGALKASGCKAVLLPPTDNESWQLGLRHSYGKECHPFISFTGDILKASKQPGFIAAEACYYAPSYFGPCLLPQYCLALHLILDRVGLGEVTVMNIADETNMQELGPAYMLRLALGMYVIDRFFKWKTEIEPYETNHGSVHRAYRQILADVEQSLATGTLFKALRRGVKTLIAVPLNDTRDLRPRVGIVGDIYTRINTHANNDLYKKLQDGGLEIWPSASFIDVSFLSLEQLHLEYRRKGRPWLAALATALVPGLRFARMLVDRHFPAAIRTPQEGDYQAVARVSGRYADSMIDKALSLNLNRIEELHQAGADGVINVMCHNCMLGTITASLSASMRRDMADLPIATLVYEGLLSTHNTNRIEAFIHQVHNHRNSGKAGKENDR